MSPSDLDTFPIDSTESVRIADVPRVRLIREENPGGQLTLRGVTEWEGPEWRVCFANKDWTLAIVVDPVTGEWKRD
jgi:hypothetical protein